VGSNPTLSAIVSEGLALAYEDFPTGGVMTKTMLWQAVLAVVVVGGLGINAAAQTDLSGPRGITGSSPTMKAPSIMAPSNSRAMAPSAPAAAQPRRRAAHLKVCGNPQVACRTVVTFKPYDLPFQMPSNAVIYDTDLFYAIILQSVKAANDECEIFVSEGDREAAQALFPDHKVFSSRCVESGEVGYTNTSNNAHFMAVYGGMTLAEANRMLAKVRATGKFPGANIRRMRAGINGT
jgi:hypothetical protein